MGRRAAAVRPVLEGGQYVVRFWHPIDKKTMRLVLGAGDAALTRERQLNAWLLDPAHDMPAGVDPELREALGSGPAAAAPSGDSVPAAVHLLVCQERDSFKERYFQEVRAHRVTRKQMEAALGRKVRSGACPTLQEAAADFQKSYAARSRDRWHTSNVTSLINSFVKAFAKYGEVDELDGKEREISDWIRSGDEAGASRKHWRRTYVLMFLTHAGLGIDRKQVQSISSMEIRRERAGIRWLEKSEAALLAECLDPYWSDVFRVQVTIGLRPTELATLKRADFAADFSELTLAFRDVDGKKEFGLKTGSRSIQVPETVRAIVKFWLPQKDAAAADPVFPNPHTGLAWNRRRWFYRSYKAVLKAAAAAAEIHTPVDSRIGRRTCASILLRSTRPDGTRYSVEDVAAILGDDPDTIRRHYARILSAEVDPSAAAI